MRYFAWFLRALLFFLLLGFAIKNDGAVTVFFFLGTSWQIPLVVVMLVMFAAGIILGATATVATLYSQRREIRRLRKASERSTVWRADRPEPGEPV